ncbi:MAG: hypothetical protein EXQ56_06575 [Acidobacteria bacterium]|nr:hypothetical protein [Acidobacteriota bacterium]
MNIFHIVYFVCMIAAACMALLQTPLLIAQQAPRYSLGIPSMDEIPAEAIPPAPAPVRRAPPAPSPQAKSPEETAAYEKFVKEQRADERIRLVEDFLLQYPQSEMKQFAYQAATEAYRRKNDLGRMLTYAELTLAENPENMQALLTLAQSLPDSVGRDDPDFHDRLEEAEQHARKIIEVVAKAVRPARVTPPQWQQTRNDAESSARLALGLTAMMREDYAAAETEYAAALQLIEKPDALTLYRLGLTYSFLKKYGESIDALQKAAVAGGVKSRTAGGAPRDLVAEAVAMVEKSRGPVSDTSSGAAGGDNISEGGQNVEPVPPAATIPLP